MRPRPVPHIICGIEHVYAPQWTTELVGNLFGPRPLAQNLNVYALKVLISGSFILLSGLGGKAGE